MRERARRISLPFLVAAILPASACSSHGSGGGGLLASGSTAAPANAVGQGPAAPVIAPVISPSLAQIASSQALAAAVDQRKLAYMQACATDDAFPNAMGRWTYDALAWIALGERPDASQPFGPTNWSNVALVVSVACTDIAQRSDNNPPDFAANALLRIAYLDRPALPAAIRQGMDDALLGWKYWIDEGGPDSQVYWSENHQGLYGAAEYLAGQLYPNATFTNSGMTGAQHMQKARPRILRWLNERLEFGFSEWNSPGYYEEDFASLFNLADFCQDPRIQLRACMVLDLLVFDLARFTENGSFAPTAGRAYQEWKVVASGQSVGNLIQILFGTRPGFDGPSSPSALAFATSSYKVPTALLAVGLDRPARFVDRSRVSIGFDEAASYGIGFTDFDDGMFWWGKSAYVAPELIATTRAMTNAWNVNQMQAEFQTDFGAFEPAFMAASDGAIEALATALSPLTVGMAETRANLYTYRDEDAMLSSVQDYNRGGIGPQQSVWQATIGMDATIFTTAPGNQGHDGPNDWTGNSDMPEVVQFENAAIVAYAPSILAISVMAMNETHEYFPESAFDEVEDGRPSSNATGTAGATSQGTWSFARKGTGYLGIYSEKPIALSGTDRSSPYLENVYICEVGDEDEFGTFAAFKDACSQARIFVHYPDATDPSPIRCDFEIPNGKGLLELDYGGMAELRGRPLPTDFFPRFDNPYTQVAWGQPTMTIRCGGFTLYEQRDTASPQSPTADVRIGDGL